MIGIFRQKNSSNVIILLVYTLALKFNLFLKPLAPLEQSDDNYLYRGLVNFLQGMNLPPIFYSFIAFILLFTQATLLNRICNTQKMLAKPTYLPAMAYILVTSLMPAWNQFSAPLVVNSLLIWIYYRMVLLYNTQKGSSAIFNIGVMMGMVTLFYQPAVLFVLLIWFALFIMRPFIIREWIIGLLGVTTPYYFLAIVLFLTNQWSWKKVMPLIDFSLPEMPSSILITISIILLVLGFIIGGFYVQNNLSKMLIQVRKNWSLLLLYLIVSTFIILVNGSNIYVNWLLCTAPVAAFHAATYYYPPNRIFPLVLHWNIFAYAIYINYWQ
ncbi:MAG: hypothetical protein H7Y31_00750 [Chitinophagaceae bacterium]|nr:hypothetical protein [Chitinophagaceae bacterium]